MTKLLISKNCFRLLLDKSIGVTDVEANHNLTKICLELSNVKGKFSRNYQTAKLSIDYQKVIAIIKNLIKTDKLGQWTLHLEALNNSLAVFTGAGHINYVKSVYLCLTGNDKS